MLAFLTEEEYEIHKKMCQLRYVMKKSFDQHFWDYHGAQSILKDIKLIEKIEFFYQKHKYLIDKEIWVECDGLKYLSITELDKVLLNKIKYYNENSSPENEEMSSLINNFFNQINKNQYEDLTPEEKASLYSTTSLIIY